MYIILLLLGYYHDPLYDNRLSHLNEGLCHPERNLFFLLYGQEVVVHTIAW